MKTGIDFEHFDMKLGMVIGKLPATGGSSW